MLASVLSNPVVLPRVSEEEGEEEESEEDGEEVKVRRSGGWGRRDWRRVRRSEGGGVRRSGEGEGKRLGKWEEGGGGGRREDEKEERE